MKKLEKLTPEQEEKMLEVKNFWLNYIFSCKNSINKEQAKVGIDFIYSLTKLKPPQVIYVDSPMSLQIANMYLKEFIKHIKSDSVGDSVGASVGASVRDSVGDSVGASVGDSVGDSVRDSVGASVWASVWDSVWDSVGDSVRDSVGDSVGDYVWASVRDSVGDSVWASVWDSVGASVWTSVRASVGDSVRDSVGASVRDLKFKYEHTSIYGNIGDYGWVSFYDFFTEIGILNNKNFNQFKNLLLSGIYDMIQLNEFCIVSNMPDIINRNERGQLHCENNSAIHWRDGYELFYWNGINIPKKWIINKELINKQDIIKETNAEKRRCLQEIIGSKRYAELLEIQIIDTDNDLQGNVMHLYKTKEKDSIIDDFIYFYNCICPSTKREYFLCVKPCNNVWAAKAQGFNDKLIQIRHGDIGLLNLNKTFKQPIYES